MIKVLDKELEAKVEEIIEDNTKATAAPKIIQLLKDLQDASGVKICRAVNVNSSAYKEVL